jgi:hypothetical protein
VVLCLGGSAAASSAFAGTTALAAGGYHTCAIRTGHVLACWGDTVALDGSYTAVTAGHNHTCAIRTDQSLICWGANDYGQLNAPAGAFKALSTGSSDFGSCAIRTDDSVACWGDNRYGQLNVPAGRYSAVTTGGLHTCAIRSDETLFCRGYDQFGEADAPPGTFKAVSAGGFYNCAIKTDGTLTCWGISNFGQTDAPSGTFTALSTNDFHACAVRTDGSLVCWGLDNYGQTEPPSGTYTALATGEWHSCAIATDSSVACWGLDDHGQTNVPAAFADYAQTVLADQPVGYWRFGETSGTTARDTADANNGTYLGGFRPGQPGIVAGDTAVSLDGQTGYVRVPDSSSLHTGDSFSVEAWVKRSYLSTFNGTEGLFAKGYQVYLDGGNFGSGGWLVLRKPNADVIARSTVAITDRSFHQVVATKSGPAVHLYIDGVDVTGKVSNRTIADTTGVLSIGAGAASTFRGVVDEAAVYNYALSAAQVSRHFAAGD